MLKAQKKNSLVGVQNNMEIFMKIIYFIDYFLIYSFLGWLLESVYKTIYAKKFVNSGFLFGPACPIYGIGAIIMYVFLSGYNNNPLHVFVIGFVVLSIWEYIVAWALEKVFNEKYWDYSNNKFNIDGRVCLLNSIFWGVLGVVFIYAIQPFVQDKIIMIDNWILIVLTIVSLILMIADFITSVIKLNSINKKFNDIKEIRNEIKNKLLELKELTNAKVNLKEPIQLMIDDLKEQETKLKEKLFKQTERIRKAFPTMKSEKFKQISKYRRK